LDAVEAVGPLLGMMNRLSELRDEWYLEDFPHVFGMIGPAAMPTNRSHRRASLKLENHPPNSVHSPALDDLHRLQLAEGRIRRVQPTGTRLPGRRAARRPITPCPIPFRRGKPGRRANWSGRSASAGKLLATVRAKVEQAKGEHRTNLLSLAEQLEVWLEDEQADPNYRTPHIRDLGRSLLNLLHVSRVIDGKELAELKRGL
jgi:hypothetical protein